jgi:hypothetical protein
MEIYSRWLRRMLSTSRRINLSWTGNKRTGLLSALVFLDLNGMVIADPEGLLYQAMIDIAEKTMDKSGLADLLRGLAKPPNASGRGSPWKTLLTGCGTT